MSVSSWWAPKRTPEEEKHLEEKREVVRGEIIKVKADIACMEEKLEKGPNKSVEALLYDAKRVLALVENELKSLM